MAVCACGAMATDRCWECRRKVCSLHGSADCSDETAAGLLTEVAGTLAHWGGPLQGNDGAVRCEPCRVRHIHIRYGQAVAQALVDLAPLPADPFLRHCVLAAAGFQLRDQTIDRTPAGFARMAHRVGTERRVPFNGSMPEVSGRRFASRRRPRPSWQFHMADPAQRCAQVAFHVFGDGSWLIEQTAVGAATTARAAAPGAAATAGAMAAPIATASCAPAAVTVVLSDDVFVQMAELAAAS